VKLEAMRSLDVEFKELRTNVIRQEILKVETRLKDAVLWEDAPTSIQAYKELEREHSDLLKKEETMWRQRSRAIWLKDGDKNTKFFHGKVGQRKRTNEIKKIKDENGRWWHGYDNVEHVFSKYYSDMFTTSNPSGMAQSCESNRQKLSAEQADWCGRNFSQVEVKEAIEQMHPLKAPGPDGLPALFYQKYWHIVGTDVCTLVLSILNEGKSPACINRTFVALIPKCKNPSSPKHFRPISLCNVTIKIMTKTIANRIKVILPEVVDEEQSAFVKGRLITDNALIAMECFHWLKKKTKGKKGMMALKLDMAKAYDKMEWEFIREVLLASGFPPNFTKIIMECISTVSYQILINGQPSRCIVPERGIRQGDPLSPYVFILCDNVLSGLMHKEPQNNNLHGIQIARGAPKITHLLFADDSLFFARANQQEAESINCVLHTYQTASGQTVSLEKSEVSYSRNMPENAKLMICNKIGVKVVTSHAKYLGLPVLFGRSKKEIFSFVKDRVWKKIKGWKEKCLSRAGKGTLIKAVAQAIPNYIMSCYKIPVGCCKDIEGMLAKFWWGTDER
jgi:hypothetical protein